MTSINSFSGSGLRVRHLPTLIATIACALLAGCGGGAPKGLYVGDDDAFFESIEIRSGGKVQLVSPVSGAIETTFTVEGNQLKIQAEGMGATIFTIDGDKLIHTGMLGTYHKEGSAPSSQSTASEPKARSSELSGSYLSEGKTSSIRIEFMKGGKARVTHSEGGKRETFEATVEVEGERVFITLAGEDSAMELRRHGDTLEEAEGSLRFIKQ